MDRKKILIQLDSDRHPSVFDRVVALDAGVDELLSYGGVRPEDVRDLVYGAIFTRGPKELRSTAVFIGGSDVAMGEEMLRAARASFFGPLSVSLLLDANGANTTAAAAVLAAGKELELAGAGALVLGGTGPVGQRAARLLAREGAVVRLASRTRDRAAAVSDTVRQAVADARIEPVAVGSASQLAAALEGVQLVINAGAAGVVLLPRSARTACLTLRVAVDLNAVPPQGIEGVEAHDAGTPRNGVRSYGAMSVGATKMKIHKAAVAQLFERNDRVLDAEEVFEIGKGIMAPAAP